MKKEKLPFDQRAGWFILSLIVILVGITLSAMVAIDPSDPVILTGGHVVIVVGIALFVYAFFAKESFYNFYTKWFDK